MLYSKCVSVFTRESAITQDIQIYKNLQDWLSVHWRQIQSKVCSSLQCSMGVPIRRPMDLRWNPERSVPEAEESMLEAKR